MGAIVVLFQEVGVRRVQFMFMFRSRDFALRRGHLGALAEVGFSGPHRVHRGRAIDDG